MENVEFGEALEKYIQNNQMFHFEGMPGVRNIEQIANVLGYSSLQYLLEDNPFIQSAIINALLDQPNLPKEWTRKILSEIGEDEE